MLPISTCLLHTSSLAVALADAQRLLAEHGEIQLSALGFGKLLGVPTGVVLGSGCCFCADHMFSAGSVRSWVVFHQIHGAWGLGPRCCTYLIDRAFLPHFSVQLSPPW